MLFYVWLGGSADQSEGKPGRLLTLDELGGNIGGALGFISNAGCD
jgi:hypothetical protein